MSVPNGAPGEGVPGPMDHVLIGHVAVPEGSPEYLAYAGDGAPASADVDAGAQPAATTDDEIGGDGLSGDAASMEDGVQTGDEPARVDTGDGEAADEDLTQYPENVRDAFKGLTREQRRALYEHAEQQVAPKLRETYETERQEAERIRAEAAAAEEERTKIRSKFGRHFGEEDIEVTDRRTGDVIATRPSYETIQKLLTSRDGDDILEDKYGMSRSEALEWKDELEDRRALVPGLAKHFDDQAWAKTAYSLSEGLKAVGGIDPDALVKGASNVGEVVQKLASTLESRYAAQEQALKKGYEDRIRALSLNGEALKGQAAAGSSRRLETDGRTGGGGDGEMTLDQYRRLTPEQQAKLPSAVIDRMTQKMTAARR